MKKLSLYYITFQLEMEDGTVAKNYDVRTVAAQNFERAYQFAEDLCSTAQPGEILHIQSIQYQDEVLIAATKSSQ